MRNHILEKGMQLVHLMFYLHYGLTKATLVLMSYVIVAIIFQTNCKLAKWKHFYQVHHLLSPTSTKWYESSYSGSWSLLCSMFCSILSLIFLDVQSLNSLRYSSLWRLYGLFFSFAYASILWTPFCSKHRKLVIYHRECLLNALFQGADPHQYFLSFQCRCVLPLPGKFYCSLTSQIHLPFIIVLISNQDTVH